MVHGGVASEAGFRAAVRDWLRANTPAEPRPPITRDGTEQATYLRNWQGKLFAAGWAAFLALLGMWTGWLGL